MDKNAVDRRVTVIALCTSLNGVGGINRHLLNLYAGINHAKYRFLIAYCSNKKDMVEKFFLEGGVKKEDLFYFPVYKKALFIPLIMRLRKLFIGKKADIVHTFFLHSDIIGFFSAVLSGRKLLISSVEGKFLLDEINGVNKLKQICYRIANSLIRPYFHRTITVSSALKEEVLRCHKGLSDKIVIINVGITIPSDEEIASGLLGRQNRVGEKRVIATAARFSSDKKLEFFLMAIPDIVKEIPQSRFVLAGAGDKEQSLRKLALDLGIQSIVSFPGWIKDTKNFMEGIDVFVMTSVREGCPFALLEALSFAKPVVAFDVPGVKEIIVDGESGSLVEPFDLLKFSAATISVCRNSEYARTLGKNGRKLVQEKFSIKTEVNKMESLYSQATDLRH